MKLKVLVGIAVAKAAVLHYKFGLPTEIAVPVSGGSTGVMVAMWEDARRRARKEF